MFSSRRGTNCWIFFDHPRSLNPQHRAFWAVVLVRCDKDATIWWVPQRRARQLSSVPIMANCPVISRENLGASQHHARCRERRLWSDSFRSGGRSENACPREMSENNRREALAWESRESVIGADKTAISSRASGATLLLFTNHHTKANHGGREQKERKN